MEEGWYQWNETTTTQLDYKTGSKNEYHCVTLKDSPVSLAFKNSSAKNKVFTISDKYFCAQSSKVRIEVSGLAVGQEVTFSVASKGSKAAFFAIVSGCEAVGNIPTFAAKMVMIWLSRMSKLKLLLMSQLFKRQLVVLVFRV